MTEKLPPGWATTDIGSLGRYINGRGFGKDEWKKCGLPIIRIQNLNDESADFNYSDAEHDAKYLVNNGDLLVAWAASLGVYIWTRGPAWLNQHIFRVEVEDRAVTKPFLYYSLKHALEALYKKTHGSGMVHVTKDRFDSHPINLPPLNEQARIVSKIDELFSRIEEGERALERVQKLVERYRQSVLKAAVTGELTREWREKNKGKLESGEALLARILKARREAWEKAELDRMKAKGITLTNDKWKQKYDEPSSPDTSDLPALPDCWTWATVEQLCFVDTGATPKRGTDRFYKDGNIDWITSAAVNEPTIQSAAERITSAAIQETNAKVFPVGSLIVAMYGEGKTRGKISELAIEAATNQACAALLCLHLDVAVKTYLRTFFEKNYAALRTEAAGGVQPNLNLSIIKGTVLPLPPLGELSVINELVAARLSQVAVSTAEFPAWGKQSLALRQKILAHAFAGNLLSQEPTDEPASSLLERITSARTTSSAAKPRRSPKTMSKAPA